MARCDQGYLCDVCGDEVEGLAESDLYLSYIIGLVPLDELTARPERHIRCNPVQAQFIVDAEFEPVVVDGPFAKSHLDADYVAGQEQLLSRGWKRLQELAGRGADAPGVHFLDYPLPEVIKRMGLSRDSAAESAPVAGGRRCGESGT